MGPSAIIDPGQRSLHPATPPDLASPGAPTFASASTPPSEAPWNTSRPLASPPMSDYEKAPTTAVPGDRGADAASSGLPAVSSSSHPHPSSSSHQQLPSLSSLFGPPPSRPPMQSPMSEHGGSLAAISPLDRPRVSTARSYAESYFPPTLSSPAPASQPRSSYDFKFDPERPPLLGRQRSGLASPGFRPPNHGRHDQHQHQHQHQHRPEPEANQTWSPHQETAGNEYMLEARSPAYPQPRDHFRLRFPAHQDASHGSADRGNSAAPAPQNTPPVPATTLPGSDGVIRKDGLGPKIWTGTHFLPRFVRSADVPGEGLCYFYDDGSHCKTVIDGEIVNAHWGVTKAGKPRKRLAIACVTCREKKIKCDPDFPRCVQCEKFGRVCKFKNAPRGGHNGSPSTPLTDFDDGRRPVTSARTHDLQRPESHGSPRSPGRPPARQPSPLEGASNKRIKLERGAGPSPARTQRSPTLSRPADRDEPRILSAANLPPPPPATGLIPEDDLSRAWKTDPYVANPQSTDAVVAQFFAHINSTMVLQLLPEQATRAWVSDVARWRSPEDLMLLYSILAVGMALGGGPKHIAFEYAQVAHYAQKMTLASCLQLAQTRVLLAVYYMSASRLVEATEVMSAATASINHLQLNLELDKTRDAAMTSYPLGLSRAGYCEARRRTLWSFFMLERLDGRFPERIVSVNPEDVYIRLPADRYLFERQMENQSPFFNPLQLSMSRTRDQPQEVDAYLVEMVHLWAECQSSLYRLVNRPISAETEASKIHALVTALEAWQTVLPSRLLFSRSNLDAAAHSGQAGSFLAMHLLCNHAMIKLNRHSRAPHQLSAETGASHMRRCYDSAMATVDMAEIVESVLRSRRVMITMPFPMTSTGVAEAVDVLSATQPLSSVDKVISYVSLMKPLVDAVCSVWDGARDVQLAIDRRLRELSIVRDRPSRAPSAKDGFRIHCVETMLRDVEFR
ncbi:Fungal specific transcription factor domain [Geosmithia morbida]|uniref:Fungal specific transcription factor domain n=1 Tax=Geosmithia morbida TaxID=1094350 RepID=A0A9P4YNJ4_9HYPO|nr:Fungal specific transcription factor domain [Geosmithia morbida]KAF4120231.1 Fungal specific transcription factor domain [Geosmithia morbida]